jgi:hypothetical protein
MFEFVSSFGISNTWWYRPTYIEHPMIQLAMLGGHAFEKILELFRIHDEVGLCKCSHCNLPLSLCLPPLPTPNREAVLCQYYLMPDFDMDVSHHETNLWLEAQTETDPVGKVLSERVRFD